MRNKLNHIWHLIKSYKIWSAIIGLTIIGIVWYSFLGGSGTVAPTFVLAEKGTIKEEVSVTGNVKPLSDVDLAFERGGRVASINVAVGDKVYAGQVLASVSNADLVASLDQARANLKIAQIELGTTPANQTTVQNSGVNQATLNLAQAKISLANAVKDSYTKADDAFRNKIYSLFTDPGRYNAKLSFTTDNFLQTSIERGRNTVSDALDAWYQSLIGLTSASGLDVYYNTAKSNLTAIKNLLDNCAAAVNGLTTMPALTQTQIDAWKSNISTARTNIDLAITALAEAWDGFETADLALKTAQNNLSVQAVTVDQAQASVASAEAELAKTIIRSPISGLITNVGPKLGEIVPVNQAVISVISYGDYEVETFVPEADISKIKIGNEASTTLDAYGSGLNFETVVIKIDPAATVIDGVPTYKVTLKFINQDDRVKSGMTANLDILTAEKAGIVTVPARAVYTKDDGYKYVKIFGSAGASQEVKVTVGLRGIDGLVEVISGVKAGDQVVTSL